MPLSQDRTVGEREMVRITSPSGRTIELLAIIDTGASSSSLDTDLAEDLGFDLDHAPRTTVASSLGRERRPVVDATLQFAGHSEITKFTVNDRDSRETLILLGRDAVDGYKVSVGDRMLTTPEALAAPAGLQVLLSPSPNIDPASLLAMLPLGVLLIVLLRVVIGLNTVGTFSPVLLALGYTQSGLTGGVALTAGMLAVGFVVEPALRRFHLPRVTRLAVLVCLTTIVVQIWRVALSTGEGAGTWGAALPVVVTAVVIERLWEVWDLDGFGTACRQVFLTIGIAGLIGLLLLTPVTRYIAQTAPIHLAVACCIWSGVAGSYRGLRVVEVVRFARVARNRVNAS